MIELTVGAIEYDSPRVVTPETSVKAAATALCEESTGVLVVLDDGEVEGVVTESTIVSAFASDATHKPVREVMATPPTVYPTTPLRTVAAVMQTAAVMYLPVVAGDGYQGCISRREIGTYLSRSHFAPHRETGGVQVVPPMPDGEAVSVSD